jgi:hypothetical protein
MSPGRPAWKVREKVLTDRLWISEKFASNMLEMEQKPRIEEKISPNFVKTADMT